MKLPLILSLLFIFGMSCSENNQQQIYEINSPASDNSSLSHLFTDNTGTVFMSWVEEKENIAQLKYATLKDDAWSAPETIAQDSTWFLNWADYPSMIAQNGNPVAAHWLNKTPGGTYSYEVNISAFDENWSPEITPHNDGTPSEHGFVSMTPASDSSFIAIWLDGRNTAGMDHHEYADLSKAMTLRGAILNQDAKILETFLIDENVCDCCNTSITKTEKGFIAAYRDRTAGEIRDIYVTSFSDGKWSQPKPVYADNWEIAACPVNGPAIDAHGNTAAVAWFTGAEGKPHVQLAISDDYGQNFNSPISLDTENPIGRVDLNMTKDKIWVSWLSPTKDGAQLKIRSYSHEGEKRSSASIQNLSKSRNSGFPQISVLGDGLIVAYTDVSGKKPTVKTLVLN